MFAPEQRVRIKSDAFKDSTEAGEVAARGQPGVLVAEISDNVWEWRGDDGTVTHPSESELEPLG